MDKSNGRRFKIGYHTKHIPQRHIGRRIHLRSRIWIFSRCQGCSSSSSRWCSRGDKQGWGSLIQCNNNRCSKIRCYTAETKVKWIQCFSNKCSCTNKCSSKWRWMLRRHNQKWHLSSGRERKKKSYNRRKRGSLNNSWLIIKWCSYRKKRYALPDKFYIS